VPEFVRGLYFPNYLVNPFLWYMTIGAGRAYPGTVAVVNSFLIFLVDIVFHLMAGNAELLGIGHFHRGVKTTPEDNARDKTNDEHCTK